MMPNDGYNTNLINLALAARSHCESSAVVPQDEAASLAIEHQQTIPAEEQFQKLHYELQQDQRVLRNQERLKSSGLQTLPSTVTKKHQKSGKRKEDSCNLKSGPKVHN